MDEKATVLFGLKSDLSPLNAFLTFSDDVKPSVLYALELAAKHLPREMEISAIHEDARLNYVDHSYGAIADTFARMLDSNFDKVRADSNSPVVINRDKFYKMIRDLDPDKIKQGLQQIKMLQPK